MPTPTKDVEGLVAERDALQKALTGLTCGGSEFFIRKGDRFAADIDACVAWVQRSRQDAHRRTVEAIRRAQEAEAQTKSLVEALENAKGFLDTPISRRRNEGDSFYAETVASIRSALSAISKGREYKDNSSRSQPCGEGPSDYSVPKSQDNGKEPA